LQNIFWFVHLISPWFMRSGVIIDGAESGVFAVVGGSGQVGYSGSFRAIYYDLKYLRNFVEFKK